MDEMLDEQIRTGKPIEEVHGQQRRHPDDRRCTR